MFMSYQICVMYLILLYSAWGFSAAMQHLLWMSCYWGSSLFTTSVSNQRSEQAFQYAYHRHHPICSFFRSSWRSGSPRIWRKSWICRTMETSGALKTWTAVTAFLLAGCCCLVSDRRGNNFHTFAFWYIRMTRSHAAAVLSVWHSPASLSCQKCDGVSIASALILRSDICSICLVYDWYILVLFTNKSIHIPCNNWHVYV